MRFGLYLKNKGVITAEELVSAVEVQLNSLVPIGQLALEQGLLTGREIFSILRAQTDAPLVRFGDLAVEMDLMKRDDVTRLLMIQADRKRPLEEILVVQGVLTREEMQQQLIAYRRSLTNPLRKATTTVVAGSNKTACNDGKKKLCAV